MRIPILCLMTCLSLMACRRGQSPTAPPAGIIPSPPGGVAGYQHGADKSRFAVGAGQKRVAEFGFVKIVGDRGTLAVDQANGSVLGILDAGPLAAVTTSYGATADDHNRFVRDYFLQAGIPADQVAGVHASTLLEARGQAGQNASGLARVTAYYSMLERAVEGVPVVDSVAWARVDGQGSVVAEAVYWPALPADVLTQALRLKGILAREDERRRFEGRLPAGSPKGKLVIRHASATVDGPFEAFASYDVSQTVSRPAGAQPPGAPRAGQPTATVIRHFDADGTERRLPQERRSLKDVPGGKKAQK